VSERPRRTLSGVFHLISFLRSKEAMQMARGAACWDPPTPWVWELVAERRQDNGLHVTPVSGFRNALESQWGP
jgi:hypothetical protein